MPLLVLILIAGGVAIAVAFVAWHYPAPMASPTRALPPRRRWVANSDTTAVSAGRSPAGSIRGSPLDSL